MGSQTWTLGPESGTLTLHTDVTGPAARLGHRLTIVMESWRITVDWKEDRPVSANLIVDVDSLQVVDGEGGVTPLSTPEKALARSNALKTLGAKRFPTIEFDANQISKTADGYRLRGPLTIRGVPQTADIDLAVSEDGDGWQLAATTEVSQRAHGVKPYSMAMGSMKVADAVRVSFTGAARR